MGFLRRLVGGGDPDRGGGTPDTGSAPGDMSDAEAARAEPTPGLLGDLPWVPAARVASLAAVLSTPMLAALLGMPEEGLHAWIAEAEPVPDAALARLAFLEELTGRLSGRHDELGVRRWFERPRAELNGRSPRDMLAGDWSPDDAQLVGSLVALTGTGGSGRVG